MYVAIDIETTGLDPETCEVLEIAMVADVRTLSVRDCPAIRLVIDSGDTVCGQHKALAMNASLLAYIDRGNGVELEIAMKQLNRWMSDNTSPGFCTALGKNVGSFDWQFLKRLKDFPAHRFEHRFMDVGSLYATGEGMISQASLIPQIAQEAAIPGCEHEAVYDARMSLALARKKWGVTI